MDLRAEAIVAAPPAAVRGAVGDLTTYPHWLRIVLAATADTTAAPPAWAVEIGARLGPFRRAKRLRMVVGRSADDEVVFERQELDGRRHSPWVLRATLGPAAGGATTLAMHLHYGGGPWLPVLEAIVAQEVRGAPARLGRYLAGSAG